MKSYSNLTLEEALTQMGEPLPDALHLIGRQLGRLNPMDALAGAAALQLMPENATQSARFEVFAHAMGTVEPNSGREVNRQHLRRLLSGSAVESFRRIEDPKWDGFTEAFGFFGGSYTVLTGIEDHVTYNVQRLLNGIFQVPVSAGIPALPREFMVKARDSMMAMLRLSDEICRRAGLERNVESISRHWEDIEFSDSTRLETLKAAVTFTKEELRDIMGEREGTSSTPWERSPTIPFETIQNFITDAGTVPAAHYDARSRVLVRRPIVRDGDLYIVAIPSALLASARNTIIMLAHKMGLTSAIARRFQASVRGSIMRTFMTFTPLRPVAGQIVESTSEFFCGDFYDLDTDKLLYVVTVTDPLDGLSNPDWETRATLAKVSEHLRRTLDKFYSDGDTREIVCLVAMASPGRSATIGFDEQEVEMLYGALSAAELETLMMVERNHPLALWKFLRAKARAAETTQIRSASLLDEFWFYRRAGYCFVMEENRGPISDYSHVSFDPNAGGGLRYEVIKERDFHTAPLPDGDGVGEVTTLHDTRDIPLYVDLGCLGQNVVAILVEELPLPIWVTDSGDEAQVAALHPTHFLFCNAVAYWFWQMAPSLDSFFESLATQYRGLRLRVHLPLHLGWAELLPAQTVPVADEELIRLTLADETSDWPMLHLTIHPAFNELVRYPDNRAERVLMRRIFLALRDLAGDKFTPEADWLEATIERHAPLGLKKMLLSIPTDIRPEMDNEGLSPYRSVFAADVNDVLSRLGQTLLYSGVEIGQVPADSCDKVLSDAVTSLYSELCHTVSTLSPASLLEWFVARQEAIVHNDAAMMPQLATREACFGEVTPVSGNLTDEIPKHAETAMANRFLIEFIVARPPQGLRPMSYSVYDHLMALASRIIYFGLTKDALYYEIGKVRLAMLPGHVLEVNRDEFDAAFAAFLPQHASARISRAIDSFQVLWPDPNSQDIPQNVTSSSRQPISVSERDRRLDAATLKEWGFSLTEMTEFGAESINFGRELARTSDYSVPILPRQELLERLSATLNWPLEKSERILSFLTLRARKDFMQPPKPFRHEDVYPWRFNRGLSHLRHPFLERTRGDISEIVWAPRHLMRSLAYWHSTLLESRYKGQTSEMKSLLSWLNNQRGTDFNRSIGQLMIDAGNVVRIEFRKGGGLSVPEELGDIDVLTFDVTRRRVHVLQCKDFVAAGTPYEMKGEMKKLFVEATRAGTVPEKLLLQVEWVRSHLSQLLQMMKINDSSHDWHIEPLIVVDRELVTPYLFKSPVPVIPMLELVTLLRQSK